MRRASLAGIILLTYAACAPSTLESQEEDPCREGRIYAGGECINPQDASFDPPDTEQADLGDARTDLMDIVSRDAIEARGPCISTDFFCLYGEQDWERVRNAERYDEEGWSFYDGFYDINDEGDVRLLNKSINYRVRFASGIDYVFEAQHDIPQTTTTRVVLWPQDESLNPIDCYFSFSDEQAQVGCGPSTDEQIITLLDYSQGFLTTRMHISHDQTEIEFIDEAGTELARMSLGAWDAYGSTSQIAVVNIADTFAQTGYTTVRHMRLAELE